MRMPLLPLSLILAAAVAVAALAQLLAERTRVPFAALLLGAGFLISESLVASGIDTGLRWYHFHELVSGVLIPLLIFDAAAQVDAGKLLREWPAITLLAGPGLILTVLVTAALLFFAIGHPQGFPFSAAALVAALLAASDPGEVNRVIRERAAPERDAIVLEGESAISDVAAVTLFMVFLGDALMTTQGIDAVAVGASFLWSTLAGLLVGAGCGLLLGILRRLIADGITRGLFSVACAYGAFYFCRNVIDCSGVVAVLSCVVIANLNQAPLEAERSTTRAIGWLAAVVLFLLAGVTVTTFMFRDQWLAMLIAILAVSMTRVLVVVGGLSCLNFLCRRKLPLHEQGLIAVGGVRGPIALALVLSLPLEFEAWYTAQSMVYGVVLFSLIVQPPLAMWLARIAHEAGANPE